MKAVNHAPLITQRSRKLNLPEHALWKNVLRSDFPSLISPIHFLRNSLYSGLS
jgi:hypothetical protein